MPYWRAVGGCLCVNLTQASGRPNQALLSVDFTSRNPLQGSVLPLAVSSLICPFSAACLGDPCLKKIELGAWDAADVLPGSG